MKTTHMRFRRTKFLALGIGMWIFAAGVVHAYPGGVTGYSGAVTGSTCGSCHSGATAPVVTLSGPTTLGVGATGVYTLTMQRSGSNGSGGLDVSVSGGTLTNNPAGTRIAGGELTHSSSNSVPATGKIWTYSWTAPTSPGTYTQYGAVSSTNGSGSGGDGSAATTLAVTVTAMNQAPLARIVGPMTAVAGTSVTFSGSSSSDPDGNIVAYDWQFGDGTAGAGASVNHSYTAGTYTVNLTVTDNAGATNSATQTITVSPAGQPQPPVANPGGPYTGTVGNPVQFNGAGSHDPDGSITGYLWNFGDNATATTVSPAHTYASAGTYPVQLTVTDNSGLTGSTQTMVTISAVTTPPPPVGDGAALYQSYCASCHGPAGRGGPDGSVVGEDAEDIEEAINEVPEMRSLARALNATQIAAIASYLSTEPDKQEGHEEKGKKHCGDGKKASDRSKCRPKHKRHRD
jgi:PKD repeat protein